jgi:flagellar protein FliO/FliZ
MSNTMRVRTERRTRIDFPRSDPKDDGPAKDLPMPRTRRIARILRAALLIGLALSPRAAVADRTASSTFETTSEGRVRIIPHPKIGPAAATSSPSSGGWWIGTAGIALALAAFGGISVAMRKFLPKSDAGPLRVIGRTTLSPRHSVYLLKAGDRVLIIGTGPQGSPTLLGEMPPGTAETSMVVPRTVSSMIPRFRVGGGV